VARHLAALACVAAVTAVSWALRDEVDLADIAMLYLVAIALAAVLGRAPSILASVLSVAALDFFFVPPFFTFHVADLRHLITFAVMLLAGVSIAALSDRVRTQAGEVHAARLRAETEELRSSLLSSVSHDLRTPLAVITGSATTLLDEHVVLETAARRDLLRTITEEAAWLERLVANVLEMSRLESGAARVEREWVPVEELVGTALTRLEHQLELREVHVRMPEAPWTVHVDPVLFGQVLVNVIDNAAKHTPPGSPIDIEAIGEADHVVIEVADRGPGIAPGSEERLFAKFQRSATSASGAGLGLAICRAIVRVHGGSIEAFARAGGGAVFRIRLAARDGISEIVPDETLSNEGRP
jgi:two-component system sensor histidine kinase KdpD